jgi:hypothetical protein
MSQRRVGIECDLGLFYVTAEIGARRCRERVNRRPQNKVPVFSELAYHLTKGSATIRLQSVDMRNRSRFKKAWASLAIRFCVAVITFAIGIAAHWASTFKPQKSTLPPPPPEASNASADPGTLRASILEAKARGENKVELIVIACGRDVGSLRTALSRDSVVLAELVGKKTYEDTWGLHTWYKFKIKETLVDHLPPRPDLSLFQSAPSDMLPIAEDEFLIQEANGRMEIDGVTVIQHSNGAWYLEDQTYLLFLSIDPSKRTAIRSGTDALGVFLVDNDGNLSSYLDESYPLKTALAKQFKNSVNNMRQVLKK